MFVWLNVCACVCVCGYVPVCVQLSRFNALALLRFLHFGFQICCQIIRVLAANKTCAAHNFRFISFHFIFRHNMPNQRRQRRRRRQRRGHSSWHSHHSHQTLFRLSIRHSTPLNTFGNNATSQSATATTTSSNSNQQQQQSVTTTTIRGRSSGNANRLPFTCIYAYLSTIIFVYWPQKLWRHADSASKCCKEKNERRIWRQGWGKKSIICLLNI